jgi:shikimate kinase
MTGAAGGAGAPRPPGPLLVVVGTMGAGKSSVGSELARRWGVPFHDTDDAIEAESGTSIAQLFRDRGEPHFRDLEHRAVVRALREEAGVVALGGGATVREDTQAALAAYRAGGGRVVYLDVSLPYAAERVGLGDTRPMIAGDSRARWAELDYARRPALQAASTLRVLTDACTPEEAADEVERRLRRAGLEVPVGGAAV